MRAHLLSVVVLLYWQLFRVVNSDDSLDCAYVVAEEESDLGYDVPLSLGVCLQYSNGTTVMSYQLLCFSINNDTESEPKPLYYLDSNCSVIDEVLTREHADFEVQSYQCGITDPQCFVRTRIYTDYSSTSCRNRKIWTEAAFTLDTCAEQGRVTVDCTTKSVKMTDYEKENCRGSESTLKVKEECAGYSSVGESVLMKVESCRGEKGSSGSGGGSSDLSTGEIIGIVIGCVLGSCLCCFCYNRYRQNKRSSGPGYRSV